MAQALYIHWPFCRRKCPYCDFNSHVRVEIDVDAWNAALREDMLHEAEYGGGEPLRSIFFGGGTPGLMPVALVDDLLEDAARLWGFAPDIEITLECNPASFETARFRDFAAAGVNRVSIGVQSLREEALQFLGRQHSVAESRLAIAGARERFERVSIDLIYARPEQSVAQWRAELEEALDFGVDHLSLYQLTIEPGTRFASDVRRGTFTPLDDDPAADLFAETRAITQAAGIPAYEISNHAVPGQESRHNLAYWRYRDYHGIGPGAHGRRAGVATYRHRKPENFLNAVRESGHGIAEARRLDRAEQATEALLMGLRLAEGIDLDALGTRFGQTRDQLLHAEKLALYRDLGFMRQEGPRVQVAECGMPVLDALLGELVPRALAAG